MIGRSRASFEARDRFLWFLLQLLQKGRAIAARRLAVRFLLLY